VNVLINFIPYNLPRWSRHVIDLAREQNLCTCFCARSGLSISSIPVELQRCVL